MATGNARNVTASKMAEATLQASLEDDGDEYIVPKKKFRPVASGEGDEWHLIEADLTSSI